MRESLSLLRRNPWKVSFWSGHYRCLILTWGWKMIFVDTGSDVLYHYKQFIKFCKGKLK